MTDDDTTVTDRKHLSLAERMRELSDRDYLLNLAERLRNVPPNCGIGASDVVRVAEISKRACDGTKPECTPDYAELWGKIREQLRAAAGEASLGALPEFVSAIANNELELAWDTLYGHVYASGSQSPTLWKALERAAELMQLPEKADSARSNVESRRRRASELTGHGATTADLEKIRELRKES